MLKKMLCQGMRNVLKRIFERFLVFELISILYFTFVMHSGLDEFRIFSMLGGLRALKGTTPLGHVFVYRPILIEFAHDM